MGPIPPEIMYFLCIVTCFDVSAMYLKCISSDVFGAFGRLVSLCIVYVSSVHSHVSFLYNKVRNEVGQNLSVCELALLCV